MEIQDILPEGHPSFGASRALFLFALGTAPVRLLSVEASNPWAILCLERILLGDGTVSGNCRVLQVVRDHRNVGTRDELTEEVPFVDFLVDIVDMDRLMGDVLAMESFKMALSDEERRIAMMKLQMITEELPPNPFEDWGTPVEELALPVSVASTKDLSVDLTSALVGLGFKKPEVRKFVASLGNRTQTDDMHSLVREGLRRLAA